MMFGRFFFIYATSIPVQQNHADLKDQIVSDDASFKGGRAMPQKSAGAGGDDLHVAVPVDIPGRQAAQVLGRRCASVIRRE